MKFFLTILFSLWVLQFGDSSVFAQGLILDADEEKMDEAFGLLDRPWKMNLVRLRVRDDLHFEMRGGLPPYDQEVEKAQVFPEIIQQEEDSLSEVVEGHDSTSSSENPISSAGDSSDGNSCFNPNNIPGFCH